jgi:hypothetical protein
MDQQRSVGATGQLERLALEAHSLSRQLLVGRTDVGHLQDDARVEADPGRARTGARRFLQGAR